MQRSCSRIISILPQLFGGVLFYLFLVLYFGEGFTGTRIRSYCSILIISMIKNRVSIKTRAAII